MGKRREQHSDSALGSCSFQAGWHTESEETWDIKKIPFLLKSVLIKYSQGNGMQDSSGSADRLAQALILRWNTSYKTIHYMPFLWWGAHHTLPIPTPDRPTCWKVVLFSFHTDLGSASLLFGETFFIRKIL